MHRYFSLLFLPLLALLLAAAPVRASDGLTRGLRYPTLTPDGKFVVFAYRGDIWRTAVDGKGPAFRLTVHEAQDTLPRVSPDGKWIAFSSLRAGGYDVYLEPVEGGMPKRITFHSAAEIVCKWAPDGKSILFMSNRDPAARSLDLYEVDLSGGTPRRITKDGAREGSFSPDGKKVVYVRGFNTIYQDDYKGSANYDIYVVDRAGGIPHRLTNTPGNERWPFFSADGKWIYFVAEENHVSNFYKMPATGGARTQLTHFKGDDVLRPDLGWDFKTAVFERGGLLYTENLEHPTEDAKPLPITVKSDVRNSGIETRTLTSGGEQPDVSPDGSRLVCAVHGDLWLLPSNGGTGKRIVHGPSTAQWPRFSPDGTKLAYYSDASGNNDLYLLDLKTGKTRQVTSNPANDFFESWSPDGKQLVFTSERSGNRDIWVHDLASGRDTQLTKNPAADDDAVFSPDGAWVAFDSGRDGGQAIYVMRSDGTGVRKVTQGAGFFQVPGFSPNGRMLSYESFNPVTGGSGGIFAISVNGGDSMEVSQDGTTARWTQDGNWIYFSAQRQDTTNVYRVRAPEAVEAGQKVPFVGQVQVDRRRELGDLFDEAWSKLRDGFYDKNMHGVDWEAMRRKYRPMAVDAEIKAEFQNVIRQMLAELDASHLGIYGGDIDEGATPAKQTGYLGAELQPVQDGAGRKILSVVRQGPADKAGLRIGDVITAIKGQKLGSDTNLDKILDGTVGKEIPVTFQPLSGDGMGTARTVSLTPAPRMALAKLDYEHWVQHNSEDVKKETKGEGRYLHLNAMNGPNLQKFEQAVVHWNQNPKVKGMVLDERNNGGGNIHAQLMQILMARPLAMVQQRGGPRIPQPQLYWDKPVVLLVNQRSFSDAEVFPFMFRTAHVGKIVGMTTAGGVIGTNDITLSDGSKFRIPRTGFYSMQGKDLEGMGVKPDVIVAITADDRAAGKDPQLAKAIEILNQEMAARAATESKKKEGAAKEESPKEHPAPQPENPLSESAAMNPLSDATVGEWVRYRLQVPGEEESVFKVIVTAVTEKEIHFKVEHEKGRNVPDVFPTSLPRRGALEILPRFGKILNKKVDTESVGKEKAEVLEADVQVAESGTTRFSITNAVPGYGLLRVVEQGRTVLQAEAWSAPAQKPVETAAKPAAPGEPVNPLSDAQTGEWEKFVAHARGGHDATIVMKVVEANDEGLTLESTMSVAGHSRRQRIHRDRSKKLRIPNLEQATYSHDTVKVRGESIDCVVISVPTPNGGTMKVWISEKIPVGGIVREERDGNVILELVDWGDASNPPLDSSSGR